MPFTEAQNQYAAALKAGQKCYHDALLRGEYPYPQVLDEILDERITAGRVDIGLIDIPTEQIIGTKSVGRRNAFAANYMPLLPAETEFAGKWIALCEANLSSEGIHDPIRCYEYLGRFYVQEGNKRVSVLKSFDAPTVPGYVTRVVPARSDDPEIRLYYEFMDFYRLSRVYRVRFSREGSYRRLQSALGLEADHVWTEEERKRFTSARLSFEHALSGVKGRSFSGTADDVFLLWLELYGPAQLRDMSAKELAASIEKILADARVQDSEEAIDMSTGPESGEKSLLGRLVGAVKEPSHLNVAFIHDRTPESSPWVYAHELGRASLERELGDKISVKVYTQREDTTADTLFDTAAAEGAQVIFATTPSLIAACRRAASKHPEIRILNCSVSMPYPGVRTYYSRIYEAKFISGAVAGAMTKTGRIGYIAGSPIFGVPAGINAFALGASLTAPDAEICLRWTCVSTDCIGELRALGCDMISNRDAVTPEQEKEAYGLSRFLEDGSTVNVLTPVWNWGEFYIRLVRSIFSGAWDELGAHAQKAVNYWWGMSSGAVDIRGAEGLPEGARELAELLKRGIVSGSILPFDRTARAADGSLICEAGSPLLPEEILRMDRLCSNVSGEIPPFEALLPIARPIVRLLGIYRGEIPPENGAAGA